MAATATAAAHGWRSRPPQRAGGPRRIARSAAVAAGLLVALLGVRALPGALPSLSLPFGTDSVDRTGPAILHAIADVDQYHAASGTYSVIVDVEQDARGLPDAIKGQRTVLVAYGSVDATVDMSQVGAAAVRLSDDGKAATITLPAPALAPARLDLAQTRVVARERGLLDRIGGALGDHPTDDAALLRSAERRIAAAAVQDAALLDRAEASTASMLRRLLEPMGVDVTVRFTG